MLPATCRSASWSTTKSRAVHLKEAALFAKTQIVASDSRIGSVVVAGTDRT